MQNLFFLGIISVGKEKIQNKNNTKTKTIKVSHFAVETAGTGVGGGHSGAGGRGTHRPPAPGQSPGSTGAGLGPKLQPVVKKEKGFRGFLQLRTQKKQK